MLGLVVKGRAGVSVLSSFTLSDNALCYCRLQEQEKMSYMENSLFFMCFIATGDEDCVLFKECFGVFCKCSLTVSSGCGLFPCLNTASSHSAGLAFLSLSSFLDTFLTNFILSCCLSCYTNKFCLEGFEDALEAAPLSRQLCKL